MPFFFTALISTLIVLGIMVLVHEFGHFAAAKLFGVRVEVFSIGFGTRLFGFRKGDTDYRLSLLPLGGYVKMTGETPVDQRENPAAPADPGDFSSHPRWQRMIIGFAGPVANFILAFLLMTGLYMMHNEVDQYLSGPAVLDVVPNGSPAAHADLQAGDRILQFDTDHNPSWEQVRIRASLDVNSTIPVTVERTVSGQPQQISTRLFLANPSKSDDFDLESIGLIPQVQPTPIKVVSVESGYPASAAGLKADDQLVAIDGQTVHSAAAVMALLKNLGGKAVDLTILRGSQTVHLATTPVWGDGGGDLLGYRLGFTAQLPPFKVEQMPLPEAVRQSASINLHYSGYILDVLHRLITRRSNVQQLSGPIGIARQTGEAVSMPGWQPLIGLMALISLNLGIMNLLPIPILDGGMITLLFIEGLLRHDLKHEIKERVYQVAFVMLILFFAFVMFNDVSKLNLFTRLKP
jgi:regulator of sigma E protease